MFKSILTGMAGIAILAAAPAHANSRCLQIGQVYNFKALDDKTLVVEDDFHNKFRIALMATCPTLTFKESIGFKTFGPATALTCVSKGDDIVTRDRPMGPQICAIKDIEPYTPAMMKADADAAAAKKAAEQAH